ncbi:DNA-binding transcriptional regulator [Alteromonas sp. V450]|uniref:sugar-binding transcriptional regulator n=1 Tax=Alteromonas sp. V450 TaxID=1912139 RepID=UPI0008FF432A|nr:sugar-binding transcriptional regulator [Alteromonas sp. V450]OJF67917.1 DNA-binding transcriptional regulator [Alteromonas sp. V450]
MSKKTQKELNRLDEAARAGWMYYVGGKTQDEIAQTLKTSRQSAQRLVALSMSEGLVKVRLEHPIARCMELAQGVKEKFGLSICEVVPNVDDDPNSTQGLGQAGATVIERVLKIDTPQTVAFGTGRVLRACANELSILNCPQHKIVSLVGNIANNGEATRYDVAVHVADRVKAQHFPMPIPVIASSKAEREIWQQQKHISRIHALAQNADISFVGIGNLGDSSPLFKDGFIDDHQLTTLTDSGACGEIISWVFNEEGIIIKCGINERVTSFKLDTAPEKPTIGVAAGDNKFKAIRGALRSKFINGLITTERTATALIYDQPS